MLPWTDPPPPPPPPAAAKMRAPLLPRRIAAAAAAAAASLKNGAALVLPPASDRGRCRRFAIPPPEPSGWARARSRPPRSRLSSSALDRDSRGEGDAGSAGVDVDFDGAYDDAYEGMADGNAGETDGDGGGGEAEEDAPSPALLFCEALSAAIDRALTASERKAASLRSELDKAKGLEATMARANLIVSNLYRLPPGTERATVEDWDNGGAEIELVLDTKTYGSAQEESDALFAAARKMKRGSKVVEELLEKSAEGERLLREAREDLTAAAARGADGSVDEDMVLLVQERLERTAAQTGFKMPRMDGGREGGRQRQQKVGSGASKKGTRHGPTFRELTSPNGLKVLVGRNRRDNEAICFQVARGDDVWMHARGCPGAHVLLQVRRGAPRPTDDDLQFAADLAAFYSDARTERKASVTTAEPKHILKPRGAPPGAVKLRREGTTLVGRPDNVSEELKQAREESGGAWDEMGYQKLGKRAQNKKRTASVLKQSLAKKRAEKREKRKRRHRNQGEDDDWA